MLAAKSKQMGKMYTEQTRGSPVTLLCPLSAQLHPHPTTMAQLISCHSLSLSLAVFSGTLQPHYGLPYLSNLLYQGLLQLTLDSSKLTTW